MLYFGAEGLITGSSSLAQRLGVTPLVIGLTVVAFGTSSPELVVSVSAAIKEEPGIAIGNVVGSNICNIALILGIAALLKPVKVDLKLIKIDFLILIGVSLLFLLVASDTFLSRIDGLILFSILIIYIVLTIYLANKVRFKEVDLPIPIKLKKHKTWIDIVFIVGGLLILIFGADLFLQGAKKIALFLGVSNAIIGLSVVAFGTSLPELATSVVAIIKKENDISLGNIIGSNIFNLLGILGVASIIHPIHSEEIGTVDYGLMLFLTLLIFPFAWTKLKVSRIEGAVLLLIYIGYIYYIYLNIPQ